MKTDLFRSAPEFEVRAADDDGPVTMVVNFARFNEWTEIRSRVEGHFRERFAPGAFRKTIAEQGDQIRVLYQHGRDPQIGMKPLGKITDLQEREDGAWAEVELFESDYVRELVPALRAGQLGASFAFKPILDDTNRRPQRSADNPDGIPEVTITEARVRELGPVTFGQYTGASASVRSLTDDLLVEQFALDHPDRLRELLARDTADDHEPGDEPNRDEPEGPDATSTPALSVARRRLLLVEKRLGPDVIHPAR